MNNYPDPARDRSRPSDSAEWLKFGLLVAVLLAGLLVLAAVARPLFQEVVPAALGLPQMGAEGGFRTFSPALEGAPDAPGQVHVVQEGESLEQIALRYGVPLQELAAANRLVNPHQLAPGTQLLIPGR
ncbi:MAG: LysM peptidoglycan-binding domain-containing protein [Candidatus Promineifilaceae bacterium]